MMGGLGFGGILFGGLFMLLFWVLVVVGVIWLVATLARGTASQPGNTALPHTTQTTLEVVKMRYARGEISKEQFEQIKRDLGE